MMIFDSQALHYFYIVYEID